MSSSSSTDDSSRGPLVTLRQHLKRAYPNASLTEDQIDELDQLCAEAAAKEALRRRVVAAVGKYVLQCHPSVESASESHRAAWLAEGFAAAELTIQRLISGEEGREEGSKGV